MWSMGEANRGRFALYGSFRFVRILWIILSGAVALSITIVPATAPKD